MTRTSSEWGYATPPRVAMALRLAGANVEKGVLDYGCGTGLSGMALAAVGFQVIDGTDISPEMLSQAEGRGSIPAGLAGRTWNSGAYRGG